MDYIYSTTICEAATHALPRTPPWSDPKISKRNRSMSP